MRPRALTGRALIGVVLALVVAGCGDSDKDDDGPSKAAVACRAQWKDLGEKVRGNDTKTNPSALAERWRTISATIEYYETSAKGSGCDDAIEQQEKAISALTAFGAKLAPYDMELRLEQVRDDAEAYAAAPRPSPSPTAKPGTKDKKKQKKAKKPPLPPAPSSISDAVKTLTAQAPVATEQQGPGWQQAHVVELSDSTAVAKAVKDLKFLSTESSGWRASMAALARIKLALAASK